MLSFRAKRESRCQDANSSLHLTRPHLPKLANQPQRQRRTANHWPAADETARPEFAHRGIPIGLAQFVARGFEDQRVVG